MSETITQAHREAAANRITRDDAKSRAVVRQILKGLADDHPLVQAEAFYGNQGRK